MLLILSVFVVVFQAVALFIIRFLAKDWLKMYRNVAYSYHPNYIQIKGTR